MGSGTGLVHYLTGPEIAETAPVTISGLRGVEPLRETKTTNSLAQHSGNKNNSRTALRFDTGTKRVISHAGTRTRVLQVVAAYLNLLDNVGIVRTSSAALAIYTHLRPRIHIWGHAPRAERPPTSP